MYTGGIRLGGTFDTGNTVYNRSNNMGLTVNNGYSGNIGLNGGPILNGGKGAIMTINNNTAYVNNTSLTITPDTTTKNAITMYYHPNSINRSNGNSNIVNMRVACNTSGLATAEFLTVQGPEG